MVDTALLLPPLLSALILGSLYALMAMGLTLIYSTIRVLNFAHGAFFMAGAYIVWWLNTPASATRLFGTSIPTSNLMLPLFVALIPAVLIMFGAGVVTQRALIKPLIRKPNPLITTLVATLALATVLESVATLIFGGGRFSYTEELAVGDIRLAGLVITYAEIIQFAVAIGALAVLYLFLKRSRVGIGMRAVAQDLDAASLCGINTQTVYLLTFGIGAALAAIAGFLLTNTVFLSPSVGAAPLTIAFIVVVFGGIGSVPGTIIASYVVALVQQYVTLVLDPSWGLSFAFILMIAVLIIRPRGLFGFRET
ncbi:MAG TPA: branched-chain amino acid ABC transporter permease [Nitrososphaerales archaeon]|nr:branched-chain amino acid ABC transporter permease [Nitrososphaerales archaeon]